MPAEYPTIAVLHDFRLKLANLNYDNNSKKNQHGDTYQTHVHSIYDFTTFYFFLSSANASTQIKVQWAELTVGEDANNLTTNSNY